MPTTQGQVFKVFEKQFPGKGGKPGNTWYSIKLEGVDVWFRCKSSNPGNLAGQVVKLVHSEISNGEAQVTEKPEIIQAAATLTTTQAATQPAPTQSMGQLGSTRESSIHYQSARKDALQFVDMILRAEQAGKVIVKLPAKEAARLEAVEALVDSYTAQYFSDISTFGAVSRSSGEASEAAEAPASDDEE